MTEAGCTEKGDDPEGKRVAADVYTEQDMKLLDLLKDN